MVRHSFFTLLRNAIHQHEKWPQMWRSPNPKPTYDVVIVGAGGHGLATGANHDYVIGRSGSRAAPHLWPRLVRITGVGESGDATVMATARAEECRCDER